MQKRSYLPILLVVLFILSITAPVIAQEVLPPSLVGTERRFNHTIVFDIGGQISIDRQLGYDGLTGAVKTQRVRGYGEMNKVETVRLAANIMKIDEVSNWSVPADALGNLRVTTIITLASRPMATAAEVYLDADEGYNVAVGDVINIYDPAVVEGNLRVNKLTQQLWATALATDPGHVGSYHADFIVAYGPGPYEDKYGVRTEFGGTYFYDDEYLWIYDPEVLWNERDSKTRGYERGDYYVGNYFNINQFAYTSSGELRRLISMSNPFVNGLLEEDVSVQGMASIRESFENHGLKGGPKAVTLAWYELF